jgi:hypothetical protein
MTCPETMFPVPPAEWVYVLVLLLGAGVLAVIGHAISARLKLKLQEDLTHRDIRISEIEHDARPTVGISPDMYPPLTSVDG